MNVLNLEKMKAKLIKTPEQFYKLKFYNDEDMLACATALLSKQNCDEIFGITDVEKLADILNDISIDLADYQNEVGKGMKTNEEWKDLFIERVTASITSYETLKQPTEIEVEILMQCIDPNCDSLNRKGCCIPGDKPRINAEGYLILKKI